jgi:MATE family multidrug resistance protein
MKIPLSILLGLGWTSGPDGRFALPFIAAIPAMGVDGCAWATVVVNVTMLLVALVLLRTQALYRPYDLWRRIEKPDWALLRHCARLGVPTALTVLVEISSFTLMALFIARQGTVASAAHQIGSNVVGVLYMLPLALGIATSARVSFWLGAGDAQQARHCAYQGLFLVSAASASFSAILFMSKTPLSAFYATNPAVAAMAASLLGWVAAYHVADAVQAVCGFILRSYRVAIAPMVIYATLLWGLGLGGALVWAYADVPGLTPRPEPSTFWICGVLALALAAVSLLALLLRATARATAQTPRQNTSPAPSGS